MSRRHHPFRLKEALMLLGNAAVAAEAARQGRQPTAEALRGLGIDAEDFRRIRRF